VEKREKGIYVADCIPYRSEVPSFPFNLVGTNNEKRTLNPFLANHTCCYAGTNDVYNDTPTEWSVLSNNEICYSSEETNTYSYFMEREETNISSEIFTELNPDYAVFMTPRVEPPVNGIFDLYIRKLEGKCTGRGNVCDPTEFSIKKIPYCGWKSLSPNINFTISATQIPTGVIGDYLDSDKCLCKEALGGQKILSISDTSLDPTFSAPINSLYCCFDDNKSPGRLSKYPCVIPECRKWDKFSNPHNPVDIGDNYYSSNGERVHYCSCDSTVIDTLRHSGDQCCNPTSVLYELCS
jgi:hypothetical protein